MSDAPLSPEMRRALDAFAPPPPAPGFAERVRARIEARDKAALPPLPRLARRWRSVSPWRRAGLIAGSVVSLSLVSAAAAATGVFGEPIHVPVISQIAQSLDLVPAPVEPRERAVAAAQPAPPPPEAQTPREKLDRLLDDPAFRALPPGQRRAEVRRTARELVQSGQATPREVGGALRETGRERLAEMTPEQRAALGQSIVARRAAVPPPVRRQIVRQRLRDARERRQEALAGETAAEPAPEASSEISSEGSGDPVR